MLVDFGTCKDFSLHRENMLFIHVIISLGLVECLVFSIKKKKSSESAMKQETKFLLMGMQLYSIYVVCESSDT